jgi:hypothetical protein
VASKNLKAHTAETSKSLDFDTQNASNTEGGGGENNWHWVRKLDAETGKYMWFNPTTNEISRSYRPPYANKTKNQHKNGSPKIPPPSYAHGNEAMPANVPPPSLKIPPPAVMASEFAAPNGMARHHSAACLSPSDGKVGGGEGSVSKASWLQHQRKKMPQVILSPPPFAPSKQNKINPSLFPPPPSLSLASRFTYSLSKREGISQPSLVI